MILTNDDEYFKLAFSLAKNAYDKGNYPVGAILVVNDSLIVTGENKVVTEKDYKYHSEIDIIKKSSMHQGNIYHKTLFVTLEPCMNCAIELSKFGIDEIFFIIEDAFHSGRKHLKQNQIKSTQVPILQKEYLELLVDFLKKSGKYPYVLDYYKVKGDIWN